MLSAELHKGNREASGEESYGRFLDNFFRYYDPSIGRYISADPIGQQGALLRRSVGFSRPQLVVGPMDSLLFAPGPSLASPDPLANLGFRTLPSSIPVFAGGDVHLYSYAFGNPVMILDPTGEFWGELISLGGTILGGIGLYTGQPWAVAAGGLMFLGGACIALEEGMDDAEETGPALKEADETGPEGRQLKRIMSEP